MSASAAKYIVMSFSALTSLTSLFLVVGVWDLRAEIPQAQMEVMTFAKVEMAKVAAPEKKTYTWLDADGSVRSITTYRQRGESRAAFCRRHDEHVARDLAKYGHSGGFLKNLKITSYFATHNPQALAILEASDHWSP